MYSDLTGNFLVQSFEGHLYLAMYTQKNHVVMQPIQSCTDKCMVETFQDVYSFFEIIQSQTKIACIGQ